MEPLQSDELILGSEEIGDSEGTGGQTVDRWKRKEAIRQWQDMCRPFPYSARPSVESLENNLSNLLRLERAVLLNTIFLKFP